MTGMVEIGVRLWVLGHILASSHRISATIVYDEPFSR